MNVLNIFLISLCSLVLNCQSLNGQRIPEKDWKDKKESEFWTQGKYGINISLSIDLNLVSFYKQKEFPANIHLSNSEKLFFSFYSPKADSILLKVEEKFPKKRYLLQSHSGLKIEKGRVDFKYWEKENIRNFYKYDGNIGSKEMCILLRLGDDNSKYILPVSIVVGDTLYNSTAAPYKAIFRLGNSVDNASFSLYKGIYEIGNPPESSICFENDKSNISYVDNELLTLRIALNKNVSEEGWFTVITHVEFKDLSNETVKFFFYHIPID